MYEEIRLNQIFKTYGSTNLLAVYAYMVGIDETSGVSPLEIHRGGLSRFKFEIMALKETKGEKAVKFNLSAQSLPYLERQFEKAYFFDKGSGDEIVSPAYSATFICGKNKGLTPAKALLSGTTKEELLSQAEFLKRNIERYPENQKLIDGINDAIKLQEAGKLKESDNDATGNVIYQSDFKIGRNQNADGTREVSSCKIVHEVGKNYPWKVIITNCVCPVTKSANGSLQADTSHAKSIDTKYVSIDDEAMCSLIDSMKRIKNAFEIGAYAPMSALNAVMEQEKRRSFLSSSTI